MIPGIATRKELADELLAPFGLGTVISFGKLYFVDLQATRYARNNRTICEFKATDTVWKALYGHGLKGFLRHLQWQINKEMEDKMLKADLKADEEAFSHELMDAIKYHLSTGGTIDDPIE